MTPSSTEQEPRLRYTQHGLVIIAGGACALCPRERSSGGARWAAVLGIAVAVTTLLVAARALNEPAPNEVTASLNGSPPPTAPPPNAAPQRARTIADTARTPLDPSATAPFELEPSARPSAAEDVNLGPHVAGPVNALTPPAPPRAAVDEEPRVADDPADFDLPKR